MKAAWRAEAATLADGPAEWNEFERRDWPSGIVADAAMGFRRVFKQDAPPAAGKADKGGLSH